MTKPIDVSTVNTETEGISINPFLKSAIAAVQRKDGTQENRMEHRDHRSHSSSDDSYDQDVDTSSPKI